jgi:hypothetical protein
MVVNQLETETNDDARRVWEKASRHLRCPH